MKTIKKIFPLIFAVCFLYHETRAQETTHQAVSSAYIELGGPSVIFAFNYDRRFNNSHVDGLGFRAGIGGYSVGQDNWLFTVPVLLNYLYGGNDHYFEGGIGAVAGDGNEDILFLREESVPVAGCVYFGYRYHPDDGGFIFRIGVPFLIGSYTRTHYWYFDETTGPVDEEVFFATPWVPALSMGLAW